MAARLGLVVMNTGIAPTYRRPGCDFTTPDITLASESVARLITDWSVLEEFTGSDHNYITFQVTERGSSTSTQRPTGTRKWNVAKLNSEVFLENFDRISPQHLGNDASSRVDIMMQRITQSCNLAMPRIVMNSRRRPVYWWTSEIAELRRICLRNRRRYTRARRTSEALLEAAEFRRSRTELKKAILAAKKAKWEELRCNLNENPWGLGYKIVCGKLGAYARGNMPNLDGEVIDGIVKGLFPVHPPLEVEAEPEADVIPPPFNEEELRAAVRSLKNGKSPGPDGVPPEVLKLLVEKRPGALLEVYNACVANGIFPRQWKIQKLTLISKGRGDPTHPSSYRPLCMLDSAGKLLEKLLKHRLAESINIAGGLSKRQFGFRPGKSAIGAIAEVVECVERAQLRRYYPKRIIVLATLDVRNAFNSLRWMDIMKALREKFRIPNYLLRMVSNYLRDRTLLYDVP